MYLNKIRTVIEQAICRSVAEIRLPGIVDAAIGPIAVSPEQVQQVATRLEQRGYGEFGTSAEVELFLHVSNTDRLRSIESTEFHIRVNGERNDFRAMASTSKDWAMARERGVEPIKQTALQSMRRNVCTIAGDIAEGSYTFQAAMVPLASELIGPYVDRIAAFLGYAPSLVRVMAARLYEAKIWGSEEVRCERWFDPQMGAVAFGLDLMVTEGKLIRTWSDQNRIRIRSTRRSGSVTPCGLT